MKTIIPDPMDYVVAFKADTRVASFTMPYVLARHGYTLVSHKSAQYLQDAAGLWKLRALTRDGISFASSNTKGVGRSPSEEAWEGANKGIAGYLVYERLPGTPGHAEVAVWKVPVDVVLGWKRDGVLGWVAAECKREVFLDKVAGVPQG